ncbi:MAG: SLBB domain-containing protein [Muribaculaceae bacterium]|nr:SLBB domain-containing protein [Muribaculaceae bacterium]
MKLTRILVPLMLLVALPAMALTDEQVITYIKTQAATGKSQKQIGQELLAQGVTADQIRRIRAQYEEQQNNDVNETTGSGLRTRLREEVAESEEDNHAVEDVQEATTLRKTIYGHDIFNSRALTFEPNSNMATPQNYRLGPGDEVIIDIWGVSEDNIRQQISPDGRIMISQLGPVYLNGLTVAEANQQLKNIFAKKYSGVGSDTDINLTLGQIRSIQIDVLGEVSTPGTYRISPFSNAFHALYNAGGINDIGSLRNIEIFRNGKKISTIDVYDFLFKGKDVGNVRLQEGDVIIVPPYSELVHIEGNVKRPMFYELRQGENLAKLIEYAGGFSGDAYSDVVRVLRLNGLEKELNTVDRNEFAYYPLKDGDVVSVGVVTDEYTNKVEIGGSVYRPGTYAINDNVRTLRQLIQTAEGLTDDAYLDRALMYREKPDRSLEVLSINLGDIMNGTAADIELRKNDIINIININAITERGGFTIQGLVNSPGTYPYADGTSLEDLILQAGGLLEGASTARVEISRRVIDQAATDATNQLAQTYTVNIEGGLGVGQAKEFILKPYDLVQVRKSPTYSQQHTVTLSGEVLFPGNYVIETRNERISDIVRRAGGLLESAYVKGAYLKRLRTADQREIRNETMRLAASHNQEEDSIIIDPSATSNQFYVGIDLRKAIESPGSTEDFVVQAGDVVFVPEEQSTVSITGDVLFPNTVVYVPGKKLKYYIEQAGGYGDRAKKNKAYVVYMNGTVAKAKSNVLIEPGSQIIVPTKPASQGFDWTKVLSFATTLGSLASMTAAVVAIFKK